VVKTKSARFLVKKTEYVVAKRLGVTEGYRQDSDVSEKMTALQAPVLLGLSHASFF
jgi:hypothetical protein